MDIRDTTEKLVVVDSCLAHSSFSDVDLSESTFRDVKLAGVTFSDVFMGQVAIRNGSLAGLPIDDCNPSGTKIIGILVEDILSCMKVKGSTLK